MVDEWFEEKLSEVSTWIQILLHHQSQHRDHANSDSGCNIDLPEHDKFRFECVTQYVVKTAVFMMKSNSIGSDNIYYIYYKNNSTPDSSFYNTFI